MTEIPLMATDNGNVETFMARPSPVVRELELICSNLKVRQHWAKIVNSFLLNRTSLQSFWQFKSTSSEGIFFGLRQSAETLTLDKENRKMKREWRSQKKRIIFVEKESVLQLDQSKGYCKKKNTMIHNN